MFDGERYTVSRRGLLRVGATVALALAAAPLIGAAGARAMRRRAPELKPDEALQRLIEGNQRFVKGASIHPNQDPARRAAVAPKQYPFATILTCSDSRVGPEVVFDQGIGDLFVVRVAGNLVDQVVAASVEYAVEELGSSLVVVLGHSKCGAVAATVEDVVNHAHLPGHLPALTQAITPAVKQAQGQPGDLLANAIRINVQLGVDQLSSPDSLFAPGIQSGEVMVVGAIYDLESGVASFLGK